VARSTPTPRLLTVGEIAHRLDVPVHRVHYVLRTREDILPVAYAGRTRLFDNHALTRIRHERSAIDARMNSWTQGGHDV